MEGGVKKSMPIFLWAGGATQPPATWAAESQATARAIVRRESLQGPLVLKPLFGSQGRGLKLIRTADELPASDEVRAAITRRAILAPGAGAAFPDSPLPASPGGGIAPRDRPRPGRTTNARQGEGPLPCLP